VTPSARACRDARAATLPNAVVALVVLLLATAPAADAAPAATSAPRRTFPAPNSVGAHPASDRIITPPHGVLEITKPTVLHDATVVGGIDVDSTLTMRNVVVRNDGRWWGNVVVRPRARLVAEDCTIKPSGPPTNPARRQDGVLQMSSRGKVTIRRCDISGTAKGALVSSGALIEDSWLHDFRPSVDPTSGLPVHKEAVMTLGGSNIRIIRCRCEANDPDPYDATTNPNGFDPSTQTAAITLQPQSPIRGVVIRDSFLQGGYYALRIEGHGANTVDGLRVDGTVFGPPIAGYYTFDSRNQIASWTGNVQGDRDGRATGPEVPRPSTDTGL
jgi:hypothetical protein